MNLWFWMVFLSFAKLASSGCLSPNVRTVLWRSSDLNRRCWSDQDIAVLYARRLFQLILPINVVSDIPQLTAHFKMCLKVVRDLATTKETHAMLMRPMVDAIGGYLQAFGLPIAIEEYYEGNLTYRGTKRVDELLKAIKKSLSTDGGRWTQPIHIQTSNQIVPYNVNPASPFENHCSDLISSADLRLKCKNRKELGWFTAKVPLPFFDNNQSPKAIAVPFRSKTLYSLFDKNARNVLLKYYTAASHCYTFQGASEHQITPEQVEFDRSFHKWLVKEVVPLLHNGVWYAAFGGVYRILATLSSRGLEFPFHEEREQCRVEGRCLAKYSENGRTSWFFVVSILGFLMMFWLVVCVVLRLRRKRSVLRKSTLRSEVRSEDILDAVCPDSGNWDNQESIQLDNPEDENYLLDENWDEILDPDDTNIISYSEECDTPHSDEMLEAIIDSLVGSSTTGYTSSSKIYENPSEVHPKDNSLLSTGIPKGNQNPESINSLSDNHLGPNSLLSTTCLSQSRNRLRLPSHPSYSISGAALTTRHPICKPSRMSRESV